jgi:23S rRNA pseudouridine1911/1915/1917 synthase
VRYNVSEPQALLDVLAVLFPESSKSTLRQMLQTGRVRVNGEVEKNAKCELDPEDVVEVAEKAIHRNLPAGLAVLHEDADVIVIFKSHGILTVPTERERETTVQAYLNAYLGQNVGQNRGKERIQVVHRLDRETSGVLVFAKNAYAREQLKEQFAAHTTERLYVALVEGTMDPEEGTFRSYLREMRDLKMVSVDVHPDAKFAVTHYRTVETNGRYSLLEVKLETGRKNQIRAHLSESGHPVVGDRMYGSEINPIGRLGLHAKLLGFDHPVTRKHLVFTAPVPKNFKDVFKKERK